jgi:hypothetical protein
VKQQQMIICPVVAAPDCIVSFLVTNGSHPVAAMHALLVVKVKMPDGLCVVCDRLTQQVPSAARSNLQ